MKNLISSSGLRQIVEYEERGIRTPKEHMAHEFTARSLTNQYSPQKF
jgi:hypothetical protein